MILEYLMGIAVAVMLLIVLTTPTYREVTVTMDPIEVVDTYQQGIPKTWNPQQ